jgi:hypothetical protein
MTDQKINRDHAKGKYHLNVNNEQFIRLFNVSDKKEENN